MRAESINKRGCFPVWGSSKLAEGQCYFLLLNGLLLYLDVPHSNSRIRFFPDNSITRNCVRIVSLPTFCFCTNIENLPR